MGNMKKDTFEKTESICPVCRKAIEADIVEEAGSLWMEKSCSSHGFFRAKIAKHAWYYKGLYKLYNLICPQGHPRSKKNIKMYFFYPTLNCNLNCKICFTNSGPDNIDKELSLDEIRGMVTAIKEPRRIIDILGGEPTIRNDLCEIIRIILKAGHTPVLFTNGLNLADPDYLRKLKMSGLKHIAFWVETLRDDSIYEKIRGARLLAVKRKALNNFKTLNMTTELYLALVRGINEGEISDVLNFAQKNNFITRFTVGSYLNLGRKGFSREEELTIDEIIEIICRETKGFVTLEEFFLFQKIYYIVEVLFLNNPVCYVSHNLFIPRGNNKKMREMFDLQKTLYYFDKFQEIYRESPFKAKAYIFEKIFVRLVQNPRFLSAIVKKVIYPYSSDNNYLRLELERVNTPYTYDIRQCSTRCIHGWLPSYSSEKIVNLCTVIGNDAS